MIRYYLQKITCFVAAMVLAFSLVGFTAGISMVVLFKNESFVQSKLDQSRVLVVDAINERMSDTAQVLNLPEEVLKNTVSISNYSVISSKIAKNFVLSYATDFSNDTEIYNLFAAKITEYSKENGLSLSSAEISKMASYAVDDVNFVLASNDTVGVQLFSVASGRMMMYLVIASVVMIVAAVAVLEVLNRGRHRKFNYIGMGIVTGGYVLSVVPIFVLAMKYVDRFWFCGNALYNRGLIDCMKTMLYIQIAVGVAFLIGGIVMLVLNYRYYNDKRKKALEDKEMTESHRAEFFEKFPEQNTVSKVRAEGEEFEKEVLKIDFEK